MKEKDFQNENNVFTAFTKAINSVMTFIKAKGK